MNSLIFILVYLWSSLSLAQYSRYGQAPGMIPRDELFPPQFNMMNSYLPKGNPALATDQPNGFNQNRGNVFNGGGNNVGPAGPPVPGPTGPGVWRPGQQPGWSQGSGHGQPQGFLGPEGREDGRLGYASSERGSGGPGPATTLARAPAPVTTSAAPAPAPAPASARVPSPAPAPAPAWNPKPHSSSESESASNERPDTSAVESSSSSSEEPRKDVSEYKQGTFPTDRTSEYRQGTFPNSKVTGYREGPFPKPDRTAEYRQGTFPNGERETSTGSAYNFGPKDRNGGETRPTASSTESGSSYNFGPRSGGSAAGTGSKGPEHTTGTEYNFGPSNGRSNNNGNGGGTGGSTGAAGPNSGARVPSSGGGSSYNFGPREGGASVPGQNSVPQTGPNSTGGSASGSAESGYEETVPGVRVGGVQPAPAPEAPSPSAETPNTVSLPNPKPETEYGVLPGAAGGEEPSVPSSGPTDKESYGPSTVSSGSSGGVGQLTTVGAPSSHQGPRPNNSGSSVGSPSPSASTAAEVYGSSPAPAPLPAQSQLPSGPAPIHPPPPPPPAPVFSRPAPPHLSPSPAPAPSLPFPAPQSTGAPAVAPYQVSSPVPPLPSTSGTENSLEGYGDGNVGTSSGTSGSSGSAGSAGAGATDSPPYRRENKPTPPPSPPTFSTTPYTFPSGNEVFSGSRGSSDYEEAGPAAPEGHSIVITDEVEESNVPPGVDPHRETDVRIAPLPPRAPPKAVSSSSTEEPMEPVEGSQLKYVPKGSQETRAHHGQSSSSASTTSTEQELQNKPHRDEDEFPQPSESVTSSHGRSSETFGSTSGQAVHNAVTDYDDDEDEERSGRPSGSTGSASGTSRTYTSGGGRVLTQSQGTTGYGFQPKTLSRVVLPNPSSKKCCSCCRGRSGGQGKHRDHTPADIDALVQELEGGGQAGGAGLGGAGRGGDPRGNSAFYKGVGQAYNGQSAGLAPRPSSYGINSGYRGYIPPVGTAGSRPGVPIGNQYTGAAPGGGGGCFCQPQQSPCCAPPRPCCPPTPPRCCSPAPVCCPQPQICCQPLPPPPAPCCPTPRPCCSQPTVPVCQRACPTCPCRRRLLAMHRIRRQAPGTGGQCQSCSTNGQPLSSSQMCGAGCRRAKRSPELLQLLGIRSGSVSPMSQCGVCRGTAMRAARTKRSFCSSSSSCSRMKRSVPWPTANSNNCVTCNNLGQVLGRFKRSPTCQQCTGTEANNRAKRSPVPCSCSTIGAIQPSSIPFPSIGMLHRKKRQAEQCDSTCCDYSACPSERPYRKFLRHLNMKSSKRQ